MRVPDKLLARISSLAPGPLDGIIVQLKIHAGRKNPYYILFPKTDGSGEAEITRDDLVGQFTDHWEMALMDYDGNLESAGSVVEATLFDPTWSLENRRLALAWPLLRHEQSKWSSREQEYENRITCRNRLFDAEPVLLDLEHTHVVELRVTPRSGGKGAASERPVR